MRMMIPGRIIDLLYPDSHPMSASQDEADQDGRISACRCEGCIHSSVPWRIRPEICKSVTCSEVSVGQRMKISGELRKQNQVQVRVILAILTVWRLLSFLAKNLNYIPQTV